jgi:hypothetical protein
MTDRQVITVSSDATGQGSERPMRLTRSPLRIAIAVSRSLASAGANVAFTGPPVFDPGPTLYVPVMACSGQSRPAFILAATLRDAVWIATAPIFRLTSIRIVYALLCIEIESVPASVIYRVTLHIDVPVPALRGVRIVRAVSGGLIRVCRIKPPIPAGTYIR